MGTMLPAGFHQVVIKSIEVTPERESEEGYIMDSQTCITYKSGNGVIKHWYNNARFKRYVDLSDADKKSKKYIAAGSEGYAVDKKTKRRLIDENDTSCESIYANLAYACGIEEGEDIDIMDLVDSELVIEVANRAKGVEVKRTIHLDDYKETAKA